MVNVYGQNGSLYPNWCHAISFDPLVDSYQTYIGCSEQGNKSYRFSGHDVICQGQIIGLIICFLLILGSCG